MIEIIHLADDLGSVEIEVNLIWMITHYHNYGYEGEGNAIGFDGEKLFVWNLSHCSCYGPFDNKPESYTVNDFLDGNIHKFPDLNQNLEKAVRDRISVNKIYNTCPATQNSLNEIKSLLIGLTQTVSKHEAAIKTLIPPMYRISGKTFSTKEQAENYKSEYCNVQASGTRSIFEIQEFYPGLD